MCTHDDCLLSVQNMFFFFNIVEQDNVPLPTDEFKSILVPVGRRLFGYPFLFLFHNRKKSELVKVKKKNLLLAICVCSFSFFSFLYFTYLLRIMLINLKKKRKKKKKKKALLIFVEISNWKINRAIKEIKRIL